MGKTEKLAYYIHQQNFISFITELTWDALQHDCLFVTFYKLNTSIHKLEKI